MVLAGDNTPDQRPFVSLIAVKRRILIDLIIVIVVVFHEVIVAPR